MRRYFPLLVVLALAACAGTMPTPACHGPLVALNADYWQPTPSELASMSAICPEDK